MFRPTSLLTQVMLYRSPPTASSVTQLALYLHSCSQSLKNKKSGSSSALKKCTQSRGVCRIYFWKLGNPTKDNVRNACLFFSDRHLTRRSDFFGSSKSSSGRDRVLVIPVCIGMLMCCMTLGPIKHEWYWTLVSQVFPVAVHWVAIYHFKVAFSTDLCPSLTPVCLMPADKKENSLNKRCWFYSFDCSLTVL